MKTLYSSMKYWAKLEKWVKNATTVDIICHTDSDGLTAAAQLIHYFKKKGVNYNVILGSPNRLRYNSFWRKIRNDLVFFVDIPADHEREHILTLSNKANIVIIDHHKIMHDMNNQSIIHYHREFLGEKRYYPASKMVYDLFKGIDWMACIGLIGDYAGDRWKKFINATHKRYGFPPCKDEHCFDSPFSKYDELISSARMMKNDEGCFKALNILINSKDWADFKKKARVLEDWGKIINDYIEEVKSDYQTNREVNGDLVFFELNEPRYPVGSIIATIVSGEEVNKTIIILIHKGPFINVNFRRQDSKYDMSKLAKSCAESVDGNGGGHREAAGASIKANRLPEFKECIKKTLKKWRDEQENH